MVQHLRPQRGPLSLGGGLRRTPSPVVVLLVSRVGGVAVIGISGVPVAFEGGATLDVQEGLGAGELLQTEDIEVGGGQAADPLVVAGGQRADGQLGEVGRGHSGRHGADDVPHLRQQHLRLTVAVLVEHRVGADQNEQPHAHDDWA